jgi:hypothetical protein
MYILDGSEDPADIGRGFINDQHKQVSVRPNKKIGVVPIT